MPLYKNIDNFIKKPEKKFEDLGRESVLFSLGQISEKLKAQHEFEDFLRLENIFCRKNIQIAFLANTLKPWEKILLGFDTDFHILQRYNKAITETLKQRFIPKVESYYNEKINDYYIFEPRFFKDHVVSFSVKVFERPIFKHVDPFQGSFEERITNKISKYIRETNGRGPSRVTAAVVGKRFLFVEVFGLLSDLAKKYADFQENEVIKKLMKKMVDNSIEAVWKDQSTLNPDIFSRFNYSEDKFIALAIIDPIDENDFL